MPRTIGYILEQDAKIGSISFDILLNRRVSFNQTTTDHPVENGSSMTDYTIQSPLVIAVRVEIGNVSIIDTEAAPASIAQAAYERLERLHDDRIFINYQTGFKIYEDMIITSIGSEDDISKPGALIADVTLKQITITDSEQVKIPPETLQEGKAREQGSSKTEAGRVEPEPPPEAIASIPFDELSTFEGI